MQLQRILVSVVSTETAFQLEGFELFRLTSWQVRQLAAKKNVLIYIIDKIVILLICLPVNNIDEFPF